MGSDGPDRTGRGSPPRGRRRRARRRRSRHEDDRLLRRQPDRRLRPARSRTHSRSRPSSRRKIDAAHLPWHVVNAGLSGETSAGGLRRIDWVLPAGGCARPRARGERRPPGDAAGATGANLQAIIDHVRADYPAAPIVLAGMRMPASMGQDYSEAFRAIYPALAAKNGLILIPFLLEGSAEGAN